MTNKQIAERINKALKAYPEPGLREAMQSLRNELDPPRPEPDTYVWWRYTHNRSPEWYLGECRESGVDHFGSDYLVPWSEIEWKPARMLADDEVAMKVPLVREWPEDAIEIYGEYDCAGGDRPVGLTIITRAEAEAREAGR
jgi:hypothetical protein